MCAVLLSSFCVLQTRAQDLTEAARQEKARKTAEQKSPRHVYTEEDLKRQVILTPEDQARAETRKRLQNAPPAEQNAQQLLDDTNPPSESLGEIARRYRQEKSARAAEEASKKKFTPFQYNAPDSSLAEPKAGNAPLVGPESGIEVDGRAMPAVRHAAPRLFPPDAGSGRRISPFQPRPLHGSPSVPSSTFIVVPVLPTRAPKAVRPMSKNARAIPDTPGMQQVEVQRGQSWWKLSELYLGSGARWPELRRLNPDLGGPPELLKLGSTVLVPQIAKSDVPPRRTIKLHRGDSLWSLAYAYLGQGSAWTCLASANPTIVDYTHLAIGTPVELPEGGAVGSCHEADSDKLQK
ncbi:MAG: LysM peptidoglycan-binding domain-containing protein [Candidatus Acidiferrum sp.]